MEQVHNQCRTGNPLQSRITLIKEEHVKCGLSLPEGIVLDYPGHVLQQAHLQASGRGKL